MSATPRKLALLLALALSPMATSSASFDCAKAMTAVEKMICADPELSSLDERLSKTYADQRRHDRTLVSKQKDWLQEVRDKCSSRDCLVHAYQERLAAIQPSGPACPIAHEQLLGDWVKVSGEGWEEAKFSDETDGNNFTSWLHHRPEVVGRWDIHDCRLHVKGDSNDIDDDYAIQAYEHGRLTLKDDVENETLVLRRSPSR